MALLSRVLLLTCLLFVGLIATNAATSEKTPKKNGDYCIVLAASGGGDRIYYQLGVLSGIFEVTDPQYMQYNVVTGISAGSLLSSLLSRYPVGQEAAAFEAAHKILFDIAGPQDIYNFWNDNQPHSGLLDTSPLHQLIQKVITSLPATDRQLRIGAVSLEDGKLDMYHENSENLDIGILGSCSVPGIFENAHQTFSNGTSRTYMDGGVKQGIVIETAIQSCLDAGYQQKQIIIDAVLCGSVHLHDETPISSFIDVALRAAEVTSFHHSANVLVNVYDKYPQVHFRWVLQPTVPLPSIGLDFQPPEMKQMYQIGRNDSVYYSHTYDGGNADYVINQLRSQLTDNTVLPHP